ncbi:hypothetical protein E2C01_079554 [Portunus trituberculatus]|uniref:Uncharacterized protein n=1 Tax=Portunus trituberculatus TaxID=210409 RepID=A0A5B7IX63_PORTR|nr:hypothetical protein [Portunus trituberculatus]
MEIVIHQKKPLCLVLEGATQGTYWRGKMERAGVLKNGKLVTINQLCHFPPDLHSVPHDHTYRIPSPEPITYQAIIITVTQRSIGPITDRPSPPVTSQEHSSGTTRRNNSEVNKNHTQSLVR